jgi:hypothetical protein
MANKEVHYRLLRVTTGITFFDKCKKHSANTILHSAKSLSSVTLGKKILGKYFIGKEFFAEYFFGHSANTLPSVEMHSAKKIIRQIKNQKLQKTANIFKL